VWPGANLDLRFVHLLRGGGVRLDNGRLRLIMGASIRVHVGANLACEG
jgi:hypothetical protein